ncbi:hypothetical protein SAMN02910384_00866 [Pseudobutyrivibrio sp. ACV-2]|uniref:hypothetical protein n=1 Tax=Pseudobutyrivibrio sp. ACV-2 TaxID=1520801 RepID=UPI00089D99CA|nr:hypothetical protein [Pseudobutyrivibrio sp. ACV-2]SEA10215.1 hypothetical protein SAMN02910384_00866 [Pseudobutyrivibrio sp. ACV-2]
MKVITTSDYIDYNRFKKPPVMDGDEGIHFLAEAFMKKSVTQGKEIKLSKALCFQEKEIKTRPKAAMERLFKESIISAKDLGCRSILIEPYAWDKKTSLKKDEITQMYLEVAELLKDTDITILIKNQYDIYNGSYNRGFLSDAYQLKDFIENLNRAYANKPFKLALDTGVANLCGQNIPELIDGLKEELGLIIPIENNGQEDSAALPFSNASNGQSWINWGGIIKAIRKIKFEGDILIDISSTQWNLPGLMKPVMSSRIIEIGHYFEYLISIEDTIRKYESRALFGAGNMCKVYMEHFGVDNTPLFTCDNNPALWGQTAYGLEIKDPKSLKDLPPDTAIIICNMYYDEIVTQLISMDLPNPIVIFNDEIL